MKVVLKQTVVYIIGFILFGFLSAEHVSAVTPSFLNLTVSNPADIDVSIGQFGTTTCTVGVSTDNYSGFNVVMTTGTDHSSLVNTEDDSLEIPTIDTVSPVTVSNFPSGYGFSVDGANYLPAPAPLSGTFSIGSSSSSGSFSYTLTMGVKTPMVATGTYSNSFVIAAVVKNPVFALYFNANTTDTVTNMPANQPSIESSTPTITIPATVPARTGYDFIGWDENSAATTPTYPVNNLNQIELEPTQANSFTLYAIWSVQSTPADYSDSFDDTTGSTGVSDISLNISMTNLVDKVFEYTNNSGRTITGVKVELVYTKSNNGNTGGSYLSSKLTIGDTVLTGSQVSVPKQSATGATLLVADFTGLNIPGNTPVRFTIDYLDSNVSFNATSIRQVVTVTYAD